MEFSDKEVRIYLVSKKERELSRKWFQFEDIYYLGSQFECLHNFITLDMWTPQQILPYFAEL